jgi:regulator of replication initiation timing
MPSNPTVVAAGIGAAATVLAACITAVTTGYHLTPTSDTREFQKTKQENMRLLQENEGLKAEIAGLRQENTGLKQQNASLHDEIAQTRSDPSHDSQAQERPATESTTRVDDYVSRLDGCQKSTSSVTCVVRVMNTKEDRAVRLYNDWTSIVDSTGNEQKAKVATLGASTNPYPWMYAETTLPANVPVRATVTFGRVDSDVNRLSILTLGIQCLAGC